MLVIFCGTTTPNIYQKYDLANIDDDSNSYLITWGVLEKDFTWRFIIVSFLCLSFGPSLEGISIPQPESLKLVVDKQLRLAIQTARNQLGSCLSK